MKIVLSAKTRDGVASAKAEYDSGKTVVLAGSKVKTNLAKSIKGGKFVRRYLDDESFISSDGLVLRDCEFNSPSIAAMLVTGNASNGYRVWKTEDGKTLGDFLKENNLR